MNWKITLGIGLASLFLAPIFRSPYDRRPTSLLNLIYDAARMGHPPHIELEKALLYGKARVYLRGRSRYNKR